MNLETTILRGRPRNRWQDEVREDGKIVGGEKGGREKDMTERNGRRTEIGKEWSHSAHVNGMNEYSEYHLIAKR